MDDGLLKTYLNWSKRFGLSYAELLGKAGLVAVFIVVICITVVLAGLFLGWHLMAALAIAVIGAVLFLFLLLALPLLIAGDALAQLEITAPVRRSALWCLRILFGFLVAAFLISLIPTDGDPQLKLMYVGLLMLMAFGISIKAIDITWAQVGRVAQWKLISAVALISLALTFPMTGKTVVDLRRRIDRAVRASLAGPVLPGEKAQQPIDCAALPARLWKENGDAQVWYTRTPDGGYELFDQSGHHPFRKVELTPVRTDQDAKGILDWCGQVKLAREEKLRAQAQADREARELTTRTEEERRKYQEDADRRTRDQAAVAQDLRRRTQEEADRLAQAEAASRADQQRRAAYLYATRLPSKVEFVVCAATAGRAPMGAFTTALAKHLNDRGKAASGIVFSPEFVTAGAFDLFFRGRGGADLRAMPVLGMGNRIFLARVSNSVKPGTSVAGLFTASVVVAFSVLSSNDGSVVDAFELRAVGAGTSESDAVSQALGRILELLAQHGY